MWNKVAEAILKATDMEVIPENRLLDFKPDTLDYLRNQYGFDTVKRVNDAIDVLEGWIAKQEHFQKKSFDRGYLERLLIYNKGSVEKSKKKLDKLCTLRTLIPEFFSTEKIDKDVVFINYVDGLLKQMTPDHGRVHFQRCAGKKFNTDTIKSYCRYFVILMEYIQMMDYCNHVQIVVDYTEATMLEFIKAIDMFDVRKCIEIAFQGFSMRIKAIHFITSSKAVEMLVSILKPMLGEKLSDRLYIYNSIEQLYKHIPKEILPQEYGGKDKPLTQLRDELYEELHSEKFTEYRKEMNSACTNESLRQKDKFNEEYLGISGTFRTMTVD